MGWGCVEKEPAATEALPGEAVLPDLMGESYGKDRKSTERAGAERLWHSAQSCADGNIRRTAGQGPQVLAFCIKFPGGPKNLGLLFLSRVPQFPKWFNNPSPTTWRDLFLILWRAHLKPHLLAKCHCWGSKHTPQQGPLSSAKWCAGY